MWWAWFLMLIPFTTGADVELHFSPSEPLVDDLVQIRITGLASGAEVTIRGAAEWFGRAWESVATFKADETGVVDLTAQAPMAGTYVGVQPMGVFWSMEQKPDREVENEFCWTKPQSVTFTIECAGQIVATRTLKCWFVRPGVRVSEVAENGLVGKLFEPEGDEPKPGLLVLSGSEGGLNELEAGLLASRGYVTLALAYFGMGDLPKELSMIPLEYLQQGTEWLARQKSVDPRRLGVIGGSKGAELALVLASRTPELGVVVASAPSHVVWFDLGTFRRSSWSAAGEPLPFVPQPAGAFRAMFRRPLRFLEVYQQGLDQVEAVEKAVIPVEHIRGPVLLISGTDDQLWPSSMMADQIVARLSEKNHPHRVEHLKFAGAGHAILPAMIPAKHYLEGPIALGGTAEINAQAFVELRPKVLSFLEEAFAGRAGQVPAAEHQPRDQARQIDR